MDNYTGPGWSNGKQQESVEFGDLPPLSYGDSQSRLHDSAYAHFGDKWHREAADAIYRDRLKDESGAYGYIGHAPLYGNYAQAQAKNLMQNVYTGVKLAGPVGAFFGALAHEAQYLFDQNHRLGGLAKERKEVLDYYGTDPLKETHQFERKEINNPTNSTGVLVDLPLLPTRKREVARAALPEIKEKEKMYRSDLSTRTMNDYLVEKREQGVYSPYSSPVGVYRPLGKKKKKKNNLLTLPRLFK